MLFKFIYAIVIILLLLYKTYISSLREHHNNSPTGQIKLLKVYSVLVQPFAALILKLLFFSSVNSSFTVRKKKSLSFLFYIPLEALGEEN